MNENIAQGVATAMAVHGAGGAARAILTGTYRWPSVWARRINWKIWRPREMGGNSATVAGSGTSI